jgi:hypothetical protein
VKRKHHGLLAIVFLGTALVLCAGYALYGPWQATPTPPSRMARPLPDVSLPEPATLKEIESLEKNIHRLAAPPSATAKPVDLGLFGYRRADSPGRPVLIGQGGVSVQFDYRVSLAFCAQDKQFCIIDGSFYQVGSVLPDQGRVLKIEPKRVLIARHGARKWIPMADRRMDDDQAGDQRRPSRNPEGG